MTIVASERARLRSVCTRLRACGWRSLGLWVWAAWLGLVSQALAQSSERERDDSATALSRAHDHFVLGVNFYRARNYREALREFELSSALVPSADVWFNIGRAHEELGEYALAANAFGRYLRDHVEGPDTEAVRARIARLEALAAAAQKRTLDEPMYGSLRVHRRSNVSQVFLDGRVVEPSELASPLLLVAGKHRFDVLEPQHIPLHALVDIQPGLLTTAYADLPQVTQAHTRSASHGLDYVLFGLAGAGALAGATFAGVSNVQRADGSMRSAENWAQRADIVFAGAAVVALAAAILYLHDEHSAKTELQAATRGGR